MFYWNPSMRLNIYIYKLQILKELKALVGSICFATEWKNNNIYICTYNIYHSSTVKKNNNNEKFHTIHSTSVCSHVDYWVENNPFIIDVKKTIDLTRAYNSEHVSWQYFSMVICDILKYPLVKVYKISLYNYRLFINCVCSIFLYFFEESRAAAIFNRNNSINRKHCWSVSGTLTNFDYFSRELKLIIKNYQCSWSFRVSNTNTTNWRNGQKPRGLLNKNRIKITTFY